ncbi:hypothetical protein BU15DRAFT_70684 [Melanogaster broomeanus]|nr:hypothetical protein BU15DRAFT_70684 [Melanogaster broomeanus]
MLQTVSQRVSLHPTYGTPPGCRPSSAAIQNTLYAFPLAKAASKWTRTSALNCDSVNVLPPDQRSNQTTNSMLRMPAYSLTSNPLPGDCNRLWEPYRCVWNRANFELREERMSSIFNMSTTHICRKIKTSSGKYLTLHSQSGNVTAQTADETTNQAWTLQSAGASAYTIRNSGILPAADNALAWSVDDTDTVKLASKQFQNRRQQFTIE